MPVFHTSCRLSHCIVAFLSKERGEKSNWINYRHFETPNSSSFLGLFETPTLKTDILFFLANEKLLAETIYFAFLIYIKLSMDEKMKESDFSTLS